MEISEATSVKKIDDKYGIAFFEEQSDKPVVHFIINIKSRDGSVWHQMTPGWYVETLLEDGICNPADPNDPKEVGLYIDFGANWFVPAGVYQKAQKIMQLYTEGDRFSDFDEYPGDCY